MAVKSFKDLLIWQRSFALANIVIKTTVSFPKEHRFGLASQLNRCSVSVPSNIAEGHARHSTKEYIRFLQIARGSLAELETQILIASEQGFIDKSQQEWLSAEIEEIGKMLNGLINKLQSSTST